MVYKVHVSSYFERICYIIKAETAAKAKYQCYKQMKETGILAKACNFYYFLTLFLDYTEKAEMQEYGR